MIISFEKDSPAAKAGLQEGDIIIGFGDHAVKGIDDLHKLLGEDQVGRQVPMTILRNTDKRDVVVVPQQRR
jgi:S1-C subfamily serine protease